MMQLMAVVITEMNNSSPLKYHTRHRKTLIAFRDQYLYAVFDDTFRHFARTSSVDDGTLDACLELLIACFTFDFMGTQQDESSQDVSAMQAPNSWRPFFDDVSNIQLFFDAYAKLTPELSAKVMTCLVQIASVRQSLFSNDQRKRRFLCALLENVGAILTRKIHLQHQECFHEVCRFVSRLQSVAKILDCSDKSGVKQYHVVLRQFTEAAFLAWEVWTPD